MTSLCFGRYGREDNTLIMTTRGEGVRPGKGFRAGGDGDRPDPGKEEVGVKPGWSWVWKARPTDAHPVWGWPPLETHQQFNIVRYPGARPWAELCPQFTPVSSAPAIMSGTSQCSISNCEMDALTSGRRLRTVSSQKLSLSRETDTYRNEST